LQRVRRNDVVVPHLEHIVVEQQLAPLGNAHSMVIAARGTHVQPGGELRRGEHVAAASALLEKAPADGSFLRAISLGWVAFGQCHWKP
jgi:hypothetical protein